MKRLLLSASALAIVVGLGAGYQWYQKKDISLTERPELVETAHKVSLDPSKIGLRAKIPHSEIQKALSELSANPYKDSGADSFKHKLWTKGKLPFGGSYKIEVGTIQGGYRWDVEVRRGGQITVGPHGDELRISVPIQFQGNAGLRGDGAKFLKLHRKNFDGALTAHFDVSMDLDENWCPLISVDVSHQWNSKARFEIIDGVFVSVSGIADDMIADQVEEVKALLAQKLNCDVVREAVAPHWRSWTVPIALNENFNIGDLSAHLNMTPESIAFSGLHVDQDNVGIAVTLTTKAELAPAPIDIKQMELPPLKRANWEPGQINIALPVSVSAQDIASLTTDALEGRTFSAKSPLGNATVEIKRIEVFQSGEKLVVGADFVADVENELFSTSGKVFLSAIPRIDHETNVVHLQEVSFSRTLDNDLWKVVSAVFTGPIASVIEHEVRYDLTDDIAHAESIALEEINKPGLLEGISLSVQDISIAVDEPVLSEGSISIVLRAGATIDAEVDTELLIATN